MSLVFPSSRSQLEDCREVMCLLGDSGLWGKAQTVSTQPPGLVMGPELSGSWHKARGTRSGPRIGTEFYSCVLSAASGDPCGPGSSRSLWKRHHPDQDRETQAACSDALSSRSVISR